MRYFNLFLILFFIAPAILTAQQQEIPDKAFCAVCVLQGENELEKVKAHAEYGGKMYYFCSKNCKKEFDEDPVAFLPPTFPRPAPDIVFETLDGNDASLKDYSDMLVLLDFWATWCKPCLKTMPDLQKLYDAYSDKGLVVVGISIDEGDDSIKKIKKFIDKKNISYPIFSDAKQMPAWHLFNVKAIPALFLIDQNQQIVAQWIGNLDHEIITAEVIERLESKEVPQK